MLTLTSLENLVLIRAASPLSQLEINQFTFDAAQVLCDLAPKVVCADLRGLRVLSREHAEQLALLMQIDARFVRQSAFWIDSNSALLLLQFDRLIAENVPHNRRIFHEAQPLFTWLQPRLREEGRAALISFLAPQLGRGFETDPALLQASAWADAGSEMFSSARKF